MILWVKCLCPKDSINTFPAWTALKASLKLGTSSALLQRLCEFHIVENGEQRSSLSLEEAKISLGETQGLTASLESGKSLRPPAAAELLAPPEFSLRKELRAWLSREMLPLKHTSYRWLAELRFGAGENVQAAELPLCSATNTGEKRHSEMLPSAAKNASSRGAKNRVQNWFHVQILGPCVVCIWKPL